MNFPGGGFPGGFPSNMDPNMAKAGANMMQNMSEEQIAQMMATAGIQGVDPALIKNFSKSMAGGQTPQQQYQQPQQNIPKKKEVENKEEKTESMK